jgi:tRNA pseudouridine38-40 synthase
VRDPLIERYAWRVWPPADLTTLRQAAAHLPGKHDFAAFGTPPRPKSSTGRTVLAASWEAQAPFLVFEITAHAFLYHMVRRLVHMQVLIGQGHLEPQALLQALSPGSAAPPIHGLAPACGLALAEVSYGRITQE